MLLHTMEQIRMMAILEVVQLNQQWLICFAFNMPWEKGKVILSFSYIFCVSTFPNKIDVSQTWQIFTFLANFDFCLDFSILNLKMKVLRTWLI